MLQRLLTSDSGQRFVSVRVAVVGADLPSDAQGVGPRRWGPRPLDEHHLSTGERPSSQCQCQVASAPQFGLVLSVLGPPRGVGGPGWFRVLAG